VFLASLGGMQVTSRNPATAAASLLRAAAREPAEHTILAENLTTMLSHFKPEFVDSLEEVPASDRLQALNGSYANGPLHLATKISREIRQKPYSDEAVLARLDHLQKQVQVTTAEVLEGNAGFPCRFFVAGSLLKGRFGANSDLDLLVEASPAWMQKNAWTVGMREDVSIQCLTGSRAQQDDKVTTFGKTLPVTPEQLTQPGFLRQLFEQAYAEKGLALRDGHLVQTAPTILRELEADQGQWGLGGMV